jgi:hypothetical protein
MLFGISGFGFVSDFVLRIYNAPWHFQFKLSPVCIELHWQGTTYYRPQHLLYFFPLPHGQGELRPTLSVLRLTGRRSASPLPE